MIEITILIAAVYLIGLLFSQNRKASDQILTSYFDLVFLRAKTVFYMIVFIGITLMILAARISPEKIEAEPNTLIPKTEKTHYSNGDIYIHNGIKYKIIEKATYRLNNLKGVVPEITLEGVEYYMVRKKGI